MNEDQLRKDLDRMRENMRIQTYIQKSHQINELKWEDLKIKLKYEQPPIGEDDAD